MLKKRISNVLNYPLKGSQIYFLSFIIYFLPTFLNNTIFAESLGDHWLRIFSYFSIPLLLFKIYVLDKWNTKQLLLITGILLLGLITWRLAHEVQLLFIAPFVIGSKNVSFRDIVSWFLYLGITLMLSIAVFALLGIIPNLIFYAPPRPPRYSLGMDYPSFIATHFLYFALAYCYLRFGKLKWFDYLLIIIGDAICMKLTNTRLDFLATLVLIPVMIIAQRAYHGYKWSRIFASFWWMAVPLSATITIFGSYFFAPTNHIMQKVNSLSSGRLQLGQKAFEKYNVNLLGRSITEHTYGGSKGLKFANDMSSMNFHYFYLDSSYMRMFLLWGAIVFVLIIVALTYLAIRSTIQQTFVISAIILVASLNFMFEPYVIAIFYNPILLALVAKPYYWKIQEEKANER